MTAKEILKNKGIAKNTLYHSYEYLYDAAIEAMEGYAEDRGCKREIS